MILTLTGAITSALAHMTLYGAAAIWQQHSANVVRIGWTDDRRPHPVLDLGAATELEFAGAVRDHARSRTDPDSWVAQRIVHEKGRETAPFSPRIAAPADRESWHRLHTARTRTLDHLHPVANELDLRMIGALGEPAHWLTGRDSETDHGASRWEMKTRNQGQEFIGNRLHPLGVEVAGRTAQQVLDGLLGATLIDEIGDGKPDSRTATGFATPGPVDNAVAWCALWGISQLPLAHHVARMSTTAAADISRRRSIPNAMFLPAPTTPITLARLRTILSSRQLATVGTQPDAIEALPAKQWLTNRGVPALIRFPVSVSDNPSAPERQILTGSPILLA
jgi:CRISPR-associated protein Csb3